MPGKKGEKKKEAYIQEQPIVDTLELNYMPYAMSVIVSRAIPEIDGFKPSHRKLLYTMYKMGLLNNARTKSSNVVGQTMKLNPHGDAAIYETMVRLTEGNASLVIPFVDSKGNFGKVYSRDMAYAAARYTEVKLAQICGELFQDIDKNTVAFVDNYDSTTKEPVLLPTTFPNILVNPNQGIAVGMASSFCGFPLQEVCAAAIAYLKNEACDLLEYLKGPEFPTGGEYVYNQQELKRLVETGRSSMVIRGKYQFDAENNCIEVTEIPYTTNLEAIIDKIILLVKSNRIRDITDIRDETDLKGLKITIDLKKNTNPDLLMHKLYSMTPLSDTFSCNFNLLIKSRPKTLGIRDILKEWVLFRTESIKNQTAFDIEKKTEKLHLLNGLSKILVDIDKAISIIRNTELETLVIPNLMDGFEIDSLQAEYIAEIKLRNINREYILRRIEERKQLQDEIAELTDTLNNENKIKKIIAEQLTKVSKKFNRPRRTAVIQEEDLADYTEEDFIDDYTVNLFLTQENYFKKISAVSIRSSSDQKLKPEDSIICKAESANRGEVLFFSDQHTVYKRKLNDFPDCKASSLGEYLPNVLGLEPEEVILYMATLTEYKGFMLFVYENGKAAKIQMESYATKVNRKKLIHAYSSRSPIVWMEYLEEDQDILLIRNFDKATLLNTSMIPENATKNSAGIQVYTLKKNSKITSAKLAHNFQTANLEYYRTNKIPSTGHFIQEADKANNDIPTQIQLSDLL